MTTELTEQTCQPLKGSGNLLSPDQCAHHLELLDGWQLADMDRRSVK